MATSEKSPFDDEQEIQDEYEDEVIKEVAYAYVYAASTIAVSSFDDSNFDDVQNKFKEKFSAILLLLLSLSPVAIDNALKRTKKTLRIVRDLSVDYHSSEITDAVRDIYQYNLDYILRTNYEAYATLTSEALRRGWSQKTTATYLKRFYGLTSTQVLQTLAYEDSLKSQTEPKIDKDVITKRIDTRIDRLLNWRSSLIATRTVVGAMEASKEAGWDYLIQSGELQGNYGKQWVSVIDDITTATCRHTNKEIVPLGAYFSNGVKHPPAIDPIHACRSSLILVKL